MGPIIVVVRGALRRRHAKDEAQKAVGFWEKNRVQTSGKGITPMGQLPSVEWEVADEKWFLIRPEGESQDKCIRWQT